MISYVNDVGGIIKLQKQKFLGIEAIVSQLTLIVIECTRRIIIRIIRDNSHKLNFLSVLAKVYKMAKEIETTYR